MSEQPMSPEPVTAEPLDRDVIRVLIADDHPMFRDGLRVVLSTEPTLEVVGEAADGPEVVELAEKLQPDVIVMDLNLPSLNGIEATRQVVAANPHIAVLVLTMFDDDDSVFSALRAGSRATSSRAPATRTSWQPSGRSSPAQPSSVQRSRAGFSAISPSPNGSLRFHS